MMAAHEDPSWRSRLQSKESQGIALAPSNRLQSKGSVSERPAVETPRASLTSGTTRRMNSKGDVGTPRGSLRGSGRRIVVSSFEKWNSKKIAESPVAASATPAAQPTSRQNGMNGVLPTSDAPSQNSSSQQSPKTDDIRSRAWSLSKQHQLEFYEVKRILEVLHEFALSNDGAVIPMNAFYELICNVFDGSRVDRVVAVDAYAEVCASNRKAIPVDKFFNWYKKHMFTHVANFRSGNDERRQQDGQMVTRLAKQYNVTEVQMEKIKRQFDTYDLDRSGYIEYEEFVQMMLQKLGVADAADISRPRLRKFWKEIDSDGSGQVDFSEFFTWYQKYFMGCDAGTLTDAFYASHMPEPLRRASEDMSDY
eukprot:TRINITY_DN75206_c0_g1_i1.p1 TRINITY_DN75206_c0_g1~~TRINITY_DN75206_c0_g1_i1.p1  ORF type:complete len:384 (+),score=54.02 TRINITY_DN75206_c0_g1_i1:60-1154(+)